MHRIDHPTAVANLFVEGDPELGQPATVVTDDIMNALQEEVAGYIESRGIGLVKADNTQLEQAIDQHIGTEGGSAFRDRCLNGGFDFWQRVDPTAGPFAAGAGGFANVAVTAADRWIFFDDGTAGAGVATADRMDFTVGQGDVPGNPAHYLQFDQTVAATVDEPAIAQLLEGVDSFAGGNLTVSFHAKVAASTLDLTLEVVQKFGKGGSPSSDVVTTGTSETVGTTWAPHSITIAVPSISGKTLGTTDDCLGVLIKAPQGSTFTLDIAEVRFEPGVSGSLSRRPRSLELMLCERFYEKSYAVEVAPGTASAADRVRHTVFYDGSGAGTALMRLSIEFRVEHYIPGALTGQNVNVYDGTTANDVEIRPAAGSTEAIDIGPVGAAGALEAYRWGIPVVEWAAVPTDGTGFYEAVFHWAAATEIDG